LYNKQKIYHATPSPKITQTSSEFVVTKTQDATNFKEAREPSKTKTVYRVF